MGLAHSPSIVTDGLVLCLDAANTKSYSGSGTNWKDIKGHDATLVNSPTYVSNSNSGYFDFDGSNDHATLPTLDIAGNELTFSVWNYGITAKSSSIIWLTDSGNHRMLNVHLPWNNGTVYFDKGGNSFDRIQKTATAEYQGWHHWAFTANASTGSMKIYLDSALWHSGTGHTKTFTNITGSAKNIAKSSSDYHRGYISNLQLYKKELSQTEVLQNYNAHKGRFGL